MNKITFYKLNGEIKSEEKLTRKNLTHIHGMMSKIFLKDKKIEIGFADSYRSSEKNEFDDEVQDYFYLWTWENLDEDTGELIGDSDNKYNQIFKKIMISDVDSVETILYSNPRWGKKLTNKFKFYDSKSKNSELDIPKFLMKDIDPKENNNTEVEQNEDELYYYLLVQYEDYPTYREYNYISDDKSVKVGDRVLVDMAGSLAIAEVLETGFFNRFDAPFPVEKTKRIIKKVDENFDLIDLEFKDEWDEADTDSIRMNIDGTYFEFGIENYIISKSDDINWANIKIQVYNSYFNYYRNSELLACSEIGTILEKLELLLDDKLEKQTKLDFYEPDLEIELYPTLNLKETGEYEYIKEGHEIQDIYMELSINLTDRDGAYTGQRYIMDFNRKEIESIISYIKWTTNKIANMDDIEQILRYGTKEIILRTINEYKVSYEYCAEYRGFTLKSLKTNEVIRGYGSREVPNCVRFFGEKYIYKEE